MTEQYLDHEVAELSKGKYLLLSNALCSSLCHKDLG